MCIKSLSPRNNAAVRWRLESPPAPHWTSEETAVQRGGGFTKVTHWEPESGFSSGRWQAGRSYSGCGADGSPSERPAQQTPDGGAGITDSPPKQFGQTALRKAYGPPAAPLCLALMAYPSETCRQQRSTNCMRKAFNEREKEKGGRGKRKEKKREGERREGKQKKQTLRGDENFLFYF